MNAALISQLADRFADPPLREVLSDLLELRIALTDDLVEMRGAHPGVLELLERTPGIDGLMLASVAHEQRAIPGIHFLEQLAGLLSADKAGFIDDVKMWTAD